MRIRRAEPSDALTIGQIRIRGWRWAYRGLLPETLLRGMSDEGREPQRRDRLRHPPPANGEVYALYLEPSLTGRGLGRTLFAHAVEDLASMGYCSASLWVLAS